MKPLYADLVFKNGEVATVNSRDDVVSAVATFGNKILYVGNDEEAMSYAGPNTRVVDLKGRGLVPGFIDSHLHFTNIGTNEIEINCTSPGVKTIAQIKAKVAEKAKQTPKGKWIKGWGYNHDFLDDKRHPTRYDLDEVAPDHPVVLVRACYHISVFNSAALKLAGIKDNEPDMDGGVFDRDEKGIINGVLRENAHFGNSRWHAYGPEDLAKAYIVADKILSSKGITSAHDAGSCGALSMKTLQDLYAENKLNTRLSTMQFNFSEGGTSMARNLFITGFHTGFGNEKFRIGAAKMMLDGSSSAPTSSVRREYDHDPGNFGILTTDQKGVDDFFDAANKAGFQATSHAVGDNAVNMIVTGIERALANCPRENSRHRIEHCALVDDALVARIKKSGIIPVSQPSFIHINGESYLKYYGEDRVSMMMPCKSFLDAGIVCVISTDCPVVPCDPMMGLYTACTRISAKGNPICPNQKITPIQALRMYTYNAAYASFEENVKGSLEVGKLADLTVLSRPLLSTPPEEFLGIKTEMTVLDGKVVYEA